MRMGYSYNIYEEIGSNVGHIVSLTFEGHTLPNDEQLIADVGICAECVIDVLPANDMQILDRAIKNPNVNLWPTLVHEALRVWPDDVYFDEMTDLVPGINSYKTFEAAARNLNMDVMVFAKKYCDGEMIRFENGKIVLLEARLLNKNRCILMHILSELTELSTLRIYDLNMSEENWSVLNEWKRIKFIVLHFVSPDCDWSPEKRIAIPDMSECTALDTIKLIVRPDLNRLVVDCSESKLEGTKEKVVKANRPENIKILW